MSPKPGASLFRNAASIAATLLSGRFVRFIYLLILARLLEPEELGIYLYGTALYLSLFGVCQFGQSVFLSQRLGRGGGFVRNADAEAGCSE